MEAKSGVFLFCRRHVPRIVAGCVFALLAAGWVPLDAQAEAQSPPPGNFYRVQATGVGLAREVSGTFSVPNPQPSLSTNGVHSLAELALIQPGTKTISVELGWTVDKSFNKGQLSLFAYGFATTEWVSGYIPIAWPNPQPTVNLKIAYSSSKSGASGWSFYVNGKLSGGLAETFWTEHGVSFTAGRAAWWGEVDSSTNPACSKMGNGILGSKSGSATISSVQQDNSPVTLSQGSFNLSYPTNFYSNPPPYYDYKLLSPSSFSYGGPGGCTSTNHASSVVSDGSSYCVVQSSGGGAPSGAAAAPSGGSVECWGENTSGELGVDPDAESYSDIPVSVPDLSGVVSLVATPPGTFCALLSSGGIKCWGANSFGQLGDGNMTNSFVPEAVEGVTNATDLSVDDDTFCAVLATGAVKCWGSGSQLGIPSEPVPGSDVPVSVQGVSGATSLSSGGDASFCAVVTDGEVKCWGLGGDLGNGSSSGSLTAVPVTGLSGATSVVGIDPGGPGTTTYCAILSGGKVDCWGNQALGNGSDANSFVPVPVTGLTDVTKLVGLIRGPSFCALQSTGGVKCWGDNIYGELGDGTTSGPQTCGGPACSTTPVAVSDLSGAVDLGGDYTSTNCAVVSSGGVKCWGAEGVGELGDGEQIGPDCPNVGCSDIPLSADNISQATAVSSGGDSNFCAVLSNGGVDCWGSDAYGDLGDGVLGQFSDVPVPVVGLG